MKQKIKLNNGPTITLSCLDKQEMKSFYIGSQCVGKTNNDFFEAMNDLKPYRNKFWDNCTEPDFIVKSLINKDRKETKIALLNEGYKDSGYLVIPLRKFNSIMRLL